MAGKKDDDTSAANKGSSPYDKSQVLQETRVFNETPLNPRKSRLLLGKVLALLYAGEHLTRPEATDLFFATTKLFQAKDPGLRQIIYLVIKELADKADDVLMVTSSLTKDINAKPDELFSNNTVLSSAASAFGFRFGGGSSSTSSSSAATTSLNSAALALGAGAGPSALIGTNVSHRADAIRALCRVTDPSMLAAIERFLKQAIVDTHAAVSTSALIAAYHLSGVTKDIVRRWANEVQEAFTSPKVANPGAPGYSSTCYIVQYHALGLLYQIRQHDRMAVAKLVQGLARSGAVRSQWAQCLLVRFAVKCCEDESSSFGGKSMVSTEGSVSASMYEFLKALCNANDMVMLEAARALCSMVTDNAATSLTATQVQPAIQALQQLLASPKPTLKFAALRTLNQLAQINPSLVSACNLDMESLVSDSNRSIATFAITTLLKTGTESSVDRLMKQIAGFMSEISDEFKVIVIDAIRVLAVKFPNKQAVMLQFLSGVLRDEGGYEYKKAVVEAIFDLVQRMPECLETALAHLCEFIEDCEFTKLAVRILNLLGIEGPRTKDPAKYLRYIYNRVILENSNVRAAAVTALASFGARVDSVRPTVRVLLSRCTDDPDDEVRDRATLYLRILDNEPLRKKYLMNATAFALPALHAKLGYYTAQRAFDAPLDLAAVPRVDKRDEFAREVKARAQSPTRQAMMAGPGSPGTLPSSATATTSSTAGVGGASAGAGAGATAASAAHSATQAAAVLEKVPELAPLVPSLFKSSPATPLTDKEMEYVVHVVKHVFAEWLVFEYVVVNTVPDALLEQVTVQMVPDVPIDAVMRQMLVVPAPRIVCGAQEPARVFVAFQRAPGSAPIVSFATTLKYVVKDCDPVTHEPDSVEGYNDEYNLEDVDLTLADYMLPTAVPDFSSAWSSLPAELIQTFQVPGTLHASVGNLLTLLGMQALEGSGNVAKDRASHVLVMAGVFMGGFPVLVRVRLAGEPGAGVTAMEVAVRSSVAEVAQMVVQAVQG
ncbi:adaptin N terminal region-domain-containing protein [Catenaria anguillulae PL171]|uniref:Coatomer subunit gamma n=1 Tax=Catenaria anguillulae PL171 TaxID=765915 RepID=A0A1Y2I437_9FUNG|nr:adaptin N terminal region-domain-containing protein [Catenaria anguillulae PL171]